LNAIATQSRKLAKGRFETSLRGFAVGRDRRHLSAALPMDAITATARDERVAVVVMGAISRRWMRGLIIGNTAERALDALSCDLLVVKPPGFRLRISKVEKGPRLITRPPGSYY
jgi:universal stress protein E